MGGKSWGAIFLAVFLFLPMIVSAGVVINEVKISGSDGVNDEFVELYNSGTETVDIGNWKIYKFTKMSTSTAPSSTDKILIKQISPGTTIVGENYFLLAHSGFVASTSTETPDETYSTNSLSSDNTVFLCRENEEVVDLVGYGDATAFEGVGGGPDPKTKSIVRSNFIDIDNNLADFTYSSFSTPQNSQYLVPSGGGGIDTPSTTPTSTAPTPTSTEEIATTTFDYKLLINEILPNPMTGEEWVEIFNPNTSSVQLAGWKLFDGVGERVAPTGTIAGLGFFVVDLANVLNNSGDIVILRNSVGEVVDQVAYGNWLGGSTNAVLPGVGESVARKIDGVDTDVDVSDFAVTVSTTRGFTNVIVAPVVNIPPAQTNSSGSFGSGAYYSSQTVSGGYSDNIKLNELVSDPSDGQTEFVELKNFGSSAVDLSGWYLKDGSGTKTEISGIIYAEAFVVVDSPRGNLNNSGDQVYLYAPDNSLKDSVAYGDWKSANVNNNAARPDDPTALARKVGSVDTGVDKNDWVVTYTLTRGAENIITTRQNIDMENTTSTIFVTSSEVVLAIAKNDCVVSSTGWESLRISEVLPNPKSDESGEFVEIENNSSSTIELCGLLLDDEDGGSRPYKINTTTLLGPHQFRVFGREVTKLAFNNDADEARILTASGTVLYSVNYEKGGEGKSYSLGENGDWYWVEQSPNIANQIPPSVYALGTGVTKTVAGTKIKKSSAGLVRNLADLAGSTKGDYVDVVGVVSVPPAIFGVQYFFIYSTSTETGAEVYMSKKNFPALRAGDLVRVRGTVSESYGQKRINTKVMNDITRLGVNVELNFPEVALDSLGVLDSGALVSLAGEITEIKTSHIYVDDGTDEIKVYFKKGTGMSVKPYALGDRVNVRGLLISTSKELQIQPRAKDDVVIQNMKVAGEKISHLETKSGFDYWHALLLALTIIFATYWVKNSGIEQLKKIIPTKK